MLNILTNIYVQNLIILSLGGLIIRHSLVISGQRWANTYHHLASYILLPVIGYFITIVIKGDLALSLGMIGALSIVRFRNPVKNPFELVMFFALITFGITATASKNLLFLYLIFLISVILGIKILGELFNKFGIKLYYNSFDDGNQIYLLSVEVEQKIDDLVKDENIIYFNFDNENKNYHYRFSFSSKKKLINFQEKLNENKFIKNISADIQM